MDMKLKIILNFFKVFQLKLKAHILKVKTYPSIRLIFKMSYSGGGGVLRFELDRGVPLEPQNPYPSLRVILAKQGTHF